MNEIRIVGFLPQYRDDMIFMVLEAKNALGRIPRLNEDLLDVPGHYLNHGDGFWIALDETDRVVGCIGTRTKDDGIWLSRLYVKAALKRRGIGSRLLETAERFAVQKGIYTLNVHLGEKEFYYESYSFYPKHGYAAAGPRYMRKQIPGGIIQWQDQGL